LIFAVRPAGTFACAAVSNEASLVDSTDSRPLDSGQIAQYLDGFVAEQGCIPSDASPVTSLDELPRNLQKLAGRSPPNEGWRAWTDKDGRIYFVRGKVSSVFSRRTARTALHVFFHDEEGELTKSGVWSTDDKGCWDPCEIPDARAGRRPADN
jgi:hypothetical protein